MRRKARAAKNFFKTPKGLLTIILLAIAAVGAPHEGIRVVAPGLISAVAAAALIDLLILRARKKIWEFPSGAVLTALIVSMVLSAQAASYVPAVASIIAVVSKYAARTKSANVFNPAAVGIIVSFYLFHAGQSWWGALSEVSIPAQCALAAAGIFMADRVNKMPMVLVFLGTYYLAFTLAAFAGDPRRVSEVFRSPDVQAVLFFAFIILTDPPTSPVKYKDQMICGALVAIAAFAVYESTGAVYFLLAGVIVGNIWEAWRRTMRHRRRTSKILLREETA